MDVIIETPRGSTEKYDYDPDLKFFRLKKMLPKGMVFPYDFGFIPGTKGEDGDPLDVIVISEFHSFPGCVIKCKLIGGIEAEQSDKKNSKKMIRNDRFIGVPEVSAMFGSMNDLPETILKELEDFFINYNKVQEKEFRVLSVLDAKEAMKLIKSNKK